MGLLFTLILGLFIVLGAVIMFINGNSRRFLDFSISLAFSVMVMLVLVDLIPEVKEIFIPRYGWFLAGIYIALGVGAGIVLLRILDAFIPDHDDEEEEGLQHIGLISSIALVLHNVIEGMAVYTAVNNSLQSGLLISLGVGLHNIPLGMVIASTFYKANHSSRKTWLIIAIISLSTFVGGLIMFLLQGVLLNEIVLGVLLNITTGMLLYISIFELLPRIFEIRSRFIAIAGIVSGVILLLITLFL